MAGDHCLSIAPAPGTPGLPPIVIVPPLFDEANRLRRTLVLMMRHLSARGHGVHLPDLPGQNDSIIATQDASLDDWRSALDQFALALPARPLIASWRGGALIDDAASNAIGWWRMAPIPGSNIVRSLLRVRIATDREMGSTSTMESLRGIAATGGELLLGGNVLSSALLAALDAAIPAAVRPLRERAPAQLGGSAIWLRAEPGEDAAMARMMAADINDWAATCAAG